MSARPGHRMTDRQEVKRVVRDLLRVVYRMATLPDGYHRCATCDAVRRATRLLASLDEEKA